MGFSSVMIDGSSLPYEENVALAKKVVEYAINRASSGKTLKMMMRLGAPQLQDKDSTYKTHVVEREVTKTKVTNGDTVKTTVIQKDTSYVFLSYHDYARYDFSSMMQKPVTLKLWLATKRGDDDE